MYEPAKSSSFSLYDPTNTVFHTNLPSLAAFGHQIKPRWARVSHCESTVCCIIRPHHILSCRLHVVLLIFSDLTTWALCVQFLSVILLISSAFHVPRTTCGRLCFLFQHMRGWSVELHWLQLPRFAPPLCGWFIYYKMVPQVTFNETLWWQFF